MPLTLALMEKTLVRRLRGAYRAAGLAVTTAGSMAANQDLQDPIAESIISTGGTVANHVDPTDADVLTIPAGMERAALDVAEIRAMENALGNFDKVTFQLGKRSVQYNDFPKRLREAIAAKATAVRQRYPTVVIVGGGSTSGASAPAVGTMADDPSWRTPTRW